MTVRHLKIFIAVCETGSTTGAARKLYIAQPTVSLAISELEKRYGVVLFDRLGRRLHITDAGQRLYQYALHIVDLFEQMESEMESYDDRGILRIGTSITIGSDYLPRQVERFRASHPQVEIQVRIFNSATIESMILANTIDLGLVEGAVHSPYICSEAFMQDYLVAVCRPDHPLAREKDEALTLTRLLKEDLLLREKGSAARDIFDSILMANSLEARPIWESASAEALLSGVRRGLGVTVLPQLLARQGDDAGQTAALRLKELSEPRKCSLIYHKNKMLPKSARDFMELCRFDKDAQT